MRNIAVIIIFSLGVLNACAPQVEERLFEPPRDISGPRTEDHQLGIGLGQKAHTNPDLSWKGLVGSAAYFEQAENLIKIGTLSGDPSLVDKGRSWIRSFYQEPKTSTYMTLADTPFAVLAAAQTQDQVQKTLTQVGEDLNHAKERIRQRVSSLGKGFPWQDKPQNIKTSLQQAQKFIQLIVDELPHMELDKAVEDGVREELQTQAQSLFDDAFVLVNEFYATKSFVEAISQLESAIAKFKIELTPEMNKSLEDGKNLAVGLNKMADAQGALTALIDVWQMLTPAERERNFKTSNESLYDFLADQDDQELACLRKPDCSGGLIKGITKKVFVLPKLKKYGVNKLKKELNEQALAYLVGMLEQTAWDMTGPSLAETVATEIEQGLMGKAVEVQEVQKNYVVYLRDLIGGWAERTLTAFQGKVPGFEVSALKVDISSGKILSLQPVGSPKELRAHTAGASMAANAYYLLHSPKDDPMGRELALSQLNKLISIGGYRDQNDNLVPALLSPVEQVFKPLDIMNFATISHSYRIPDRIKMQDAFHINGKVKYEKNFSAFAFAEQIRGLSEMLEVMADWKKTGYDELIGQVRAQELTDQIQSESLQRALFPKDMFFALNLGDVSVLLQDIARKATPVFLLTLDKKVLWADEYNSNSSDTAIMAGIVDIKNGSRVNVVNSQDVAKFLISLGTFLRATEGAGQTQSEILHEKDVDNKTALMTLHEGRQDLKQLVLALGNFISNQLMSPKSLVAAQYYLKERERANDPRFLVEEQVYAIRALLMAGDVTGIDAYKWAAQEIYYSMNRNLYSKAHQFYINGDGSTLALPEKTKVLLALLELKPHLPLPSQKQLEGVIQPWLKALKALP